MKSIKINTASNIFNIIYFCFFLLFPLVYISEIVDPVLVPRQIFLTVFTLLICIIICLKISKKKLVADFTQVKLLVPLLFFGLLFICFISFFQSVSVSESVYVFSKFLIEVLFFILTTFLIIHDQLQVNNILKSIIIFSLISVIIALYQVLNIYFTEKEFFINVFLIKSSFANKNLFASILFMAFPFLLNAFVLPGIWKIISFVLIALSLILVWIMQSKAVIAAFIVFFFVYGVFLLRYRKNIINRQFVFIVSVCIAVILITAGIITNKNKENFAMIFNKNSASSRFLIWDNTVEIVKENYLFGVGAGNWQIHFPKYGLEKFADDEKSGMTTYQRPHNDFLWIFSELGIFGILFYVSIFGLIFYYLLKLIFKLKEHENKWLFISFFAAVSGYFIIALVDFPLERIEHQVLLLLIFSFITGLYYKNFKIEESSKKIIVKLPLLSLLLFVPVLFSFICSFARFSGEYYSRKLHEAHLNSNWALMVLEADRAHNFLYTMDPTSAPVNWYKGVALFYSGKIDEAEKSFEIAYSEHPYNIHVLNNLASCYESKRDHEKAIEFYNKALCITPSFDEAILNLAAVYYNMRDFEKAYLTIDQCKATTADAKYKIFLPAILNAWIDVQITKSANKENFQFLTNIKSSKENLVALYLQSKENNISFIRYLNQINK